MVLIAEKYNQSSDPSSVQSGKEGIFSNFKGHEIQFDVSHVVATTKVYIFPMQ